MEPSMDRVADAADTLRAYAAGMVTTHRNLGGLTKEELQRVRARFRGLWEELDQALVDFGGDPMAPGDVVQLAPDTNWMWRGCMLLVDDVRPNCVEGHIFVPAVGDVAAHRKFLRAGFDEVARVGRAPWSDLSNGWLAPARRGP